MRCRDPKLGYDERQRTKIVGKVKTQLAHDNPGHKRNAIRTLTELGVNDFRTIMELIALLTNEDVSIKICLFLAIISRVFVEASHQKSDVKSIVLGLEDRNQLHE